VFLCPLKPIFNNNPPRTSVPYVFVYSKVRITKVSFTAADESTLLLVTFFCRRVPDPYFRFLIMSCVRLAVRALVCCPEADNYTPTAMT